MASVVAASGCSGSKGTEETRSTTRAPASTTTATYAVPGAPDRVVVRGGATLDGAPFDARFLGAVVRRGGLITPCQGTIPSVERGRYAITVLAESEGSGCGGRGAQVLLWTFAGDKKLYSSTAIAWPGNGRVANFDASFSSAAPVGGAAAVSEFSGAVFDRSGQKLPPGTRVEAYVGDTRCGIASTRNAGDFFGYVLSVVGPDSIAGCARGGTVTFRVDGRPATETAVNRLGAPAPGSGGSFDLTLP
jgi:hypothetical protein